MPGVDAVPFQLESRRPLPRGERANGSWRFAWTGPALMGIVNATPDSFSDGGRLADAASAIARGRALAAAGAVVVDVGGESTRPGAEPVPVDEELRRVVPVVEALADAGVMVSVDTSKAEVVRAAVGAGAHLVNDVTGLRDPAMLAAVAEAGVPAIVMHMQGEPRSMQDAPRYGNVVAEVESWLLERAAAARAAGVPSVAIDPGLGFGKALEHNLALTRALPRLASHGLPVVIGASRKRSIGRLTGVDEPAERDPGSIAWHLRAALSGAALLRVHDVAGHAQALAVWMALDG